MFHNDLKAKYVLRTYYILYCYTHIKYFNENSDEEFLRFFIVINYSSLYQIKKCQFIQPDFYEIKLSILDIDPYNLESHICHVFKDE